MIALIVLVAALGDTFRGAPWYEELKSWQDGIAAVIAFAGLIAAALVGLDGVRGQIAANARDAEQRHEREQTTEKLRIAAALAGEVAAIVDTIAIGREALEILLSDADDPINRRDYFVSSLRSDSRAAHPMRIYEGLTGSIGMLGHAIVEKEARFYTDLESTRRGYWSGYADEVGAIPSDLVEMSLNTYLSTTIRLKIRGDLLIYALKSFIAETRGEEPPEPPELAADFAHGLNLVKSPEKDETDPPARST